MKRIAIALSLLMALPAMADQPRMYCGCPIQQHGTTSPVRGDTGTQTPSVGYPTTITKTPGQQESESQQPQGYITIPANTGPNTTDGAITLPYYIAEPPPKRPGPFKRAFRWVRHKCMIVGPIIGTVASIASLVVLFL